MTALSLLLATLASAPASAAPIHEIELKAQAYAGNAMQLVGGLDRRLTARIHELCGSGKQEVLIHRYEVTVAALGQGKFPLEGEVSEGTDHGVFLPAYPGAQLRATIECKP